MTEPRLLVERDGSILVVTLNRPATGNALAGDDSVALADVFDEASSGTATRAVLLRGAGKHFCTGADLSGGGGGETPANGHMVRSLGATYHRAVASIFDCRVPVVAEVQGAAIGFGLHLALACDFVVASTAATFTEPFADRGFSIDSGGSWLLPRLIGLSRAKRMIYFAERVSASDALDWGLIFDVADPADLEARTRGHVESLASGPTQMLAASKRLVHDGLRTDLAGAVHAESMAVELTLRSKDFKEGMSAFSQKRPPTFRGE